MSDQHKNSKSNYDRWKPGTKLACMMSLKQVCQDPKFYDATNNRFNSLTWHTVAENLNKEYPHYAKRFTNINVKDRYDRVLKHHKVFKKMANKINGFVWNPKTFCFESNEDLLKQYEQGYIKDDVITKELNIVRFLSKPGHIDLEYYHRYIYQFPTQEELRNDAIIQCPSYIEDAISKGILNLITKSSFINKSDGTSHSDSFQSSSSPVMLQNQPTIHHHQSTSSSNTTNSSSSLPVITTSQNPSTSQSLIPNSSISSQSSAPLINIPHHQHQQHQIVPNQQQQQQQPHPVPQILSNSSQQQSLPNPQQSSSQDLDFSGLINSEASSVSSHQQSQHSQQQHPNPMMNPNLTMSLQMSGDLNIPPPPVPTGPPGSARGSLGQPPFKKPRTTSVPNSSSAVSSGIINTGLIGDNYESMLDVQPGSGSSQGGQASKFGIGISSGEAILQLHKEFDMMRNLVNEQILNLRMAKLINYQDFNQVQQVLNSNDQFIRSAYKRLGDDQKLIELINIYLNRID